MTVLRNVLQEVVHLFVDNGSLALALVLWCAVVRLAVAFLPSFVAVLGPVLLVGCAVILLVNIIQTARAHVATKTS